MARAGLWLALPIPALNVLQSWYQGALVHKRSTRAISESVAGSLFASSLVLAAGVMRGHMAGLYIGMAGFTIGNLAQTIWLWYRSRPVMARLRTRDAATDGYQPTSPECLSLSRNT